MFEPGVRLAIILAATLLGFWGVVSGVGVGWLLLFAALLLAYGHTRWGTVWLAHRAWQKGDIDRMKALLSRVKHPQQLTRQGRAYFKLMSGVASLAEGRYPDARAHFEAAIHEGLRTANDRSLAHGLYAEAALAQGRLEEARAHLSATAHLEAKPVVKQYLDALSARLSAT